MALVATYNPDLSRIVLTGDALGLTATYAVFDRTLNGITYQTVRGASAAPVTSQVASVDDFEFPAGVLITYRVRSYDATNVLQQTFTTTITQTLTEPWLKSVTRVYLNRQIDIADAGDITHTSRASIFTVLARSNPVAVTDVSSQRSYDLRLRTETLEEGDAIRYMVTSGDILFLQTPPEYPIPDGYYAVGNVTESRQNMPWDLRWFTLPLTEVAAPGSDVVGATYTITSMLAEYATITAVIADNATIIDLLERVADASEVVVP